MSKRATRGGKKNGRRDIRVATLAGGIGGALEVTATWPTEYCKTQLQLQKITASGKVLPAIGQPEVYRGPWDCATKIVKREGIRGVYRGLSPILLLSFPKCGVRFGSYELFANWLFDGGSDGGLTTSQTLVCGLLSGVSDATLVITPQETIKVSLININTGLVAGLRTVVATEGIRGLYKGLLPTVLKSSTNQAVRFVSFAQYKRFVTERTGSPLSVPQALGGGMLAGALSVLLNNPVDCVKTRMQGMNASQYTSSWHCVVTTLREEGPLAFYKGTVARLCRVVPGQAIVFATYDTITQWVESFLQPPPE